MKNKSPNKYGKVFFILVIFLGLYKLICFYDFSPQDLDFASQPKLVYLEDNGFVFPLSTRASSFDDLLSEKKIALGEHDEVNLSLETPLYPHIHLVIKRAVKIKIEVDGKEQAHYTTQKTVKGALAEKGVVLGRLDKTTPNIFYPPQENLTIQVTRINVEEVVKKEEIDFKTTSKNDSQLGWREKKIDQKGEKGIREIKYKITYKDGKEVSRLILEKNVIKEPITQIEIQGTYVKTGKAHKGQGTWYAFKGGLYAASPWLPMGSFAKVTNTATGKSVIVEINDRGPFGKGRIIDLDKVAFQKIASLGAGVIDVKVEEILN